MKQVDGQSLIEVIVSVGIAAILAVAIISASLVSNKTARTARSNAQATKLAEEYIEEIRVFRDRQGYGALSNNSCYIINMPSSDPSSWTLTDGGSCPQTLVEGGMNFTRQLAIADGTDLNTKLITATVQWIDSGGTQTVTSHTILSLWQGP